MSGNSIGFGEEIKKLCVIYACLSGALFIRITVKASDEKKDYLEERNLHIFLFFLNHANMLNFPHCVQNGFANEWLKGI